MHYTKKIDTKIIQGQALTFHEIEILENRRIQKERDYFVVEGSKKEAMKAEYKTILI